MKSTVPVLLRGAIGVALAVALLPASRPSAQRAELAPQDGSSATPAPKLSPDGKKVLTLADYGPWKRITSTALSDDGKWMTYTLSPNDGDETLVVKQLDGETSYTIPIGLPAAGGRGGGGRGGAAGGGASVQFSDDGHWIAYYVNPPSPPAGRGRGTAPGAGGGAGQTGGQGGGRGGGRTGAAAGGGANGGAANGGAARDASSCST